MTDEQAEHFAAYKAGRGEFEPLPSQMFEIRGSDGWNIANKLLGTEAAPRGFRAKQIISAMIANQQSLMNEEVVGLKAESKQLSAEGGGAAAATAAGRFSTGRSAHSVRSLPKVVDY